MPKLKNSLPGQPLAAMFDRLAEKSSLDLVCQRAGTHVRQVNRWRHGDQPASLEDADRALTGLNALWFDVYNEETVREPLFVVHVFAHQMKKVGRVRRAYRVRVRSIPYGDIGTDFAALNQIERLFAGERAAAA